MKAELMGNIQEIIASVTELVEKLRAIDNNMDLTIAEEAEQVITSVS